MEKHYPSFTHVGTIKILRKSIFIFFKNYQYFTTTAALLVFPFAASLLIAQSFVPSSILESTIHSRLRSILYAAGFPYSSEFVTVFTLKLSQTISTSLIIFPLSFSFLLFAKASIIRALSNPNNATQAPFEQAISAFKPLFITQLCNFLLVLSANATCFAILSFAFNALDGLGLWNSNSVLILSSLGAVLYSIMLANALTVCNLALILSGDKKCGGFMAILRACVLIKGRTATGLSLLFPTNLALASVEALFQYRIVRAYHHSEDTFSSVALEGMFIAYLYAIVLVLDTIVAFFFFRSCKSACQVDQESRHLFGTVQLDDKDGNGLVPLKSIDDLP
ncbi:hypothetical protein Leryth_013107 [Lithospermum erythrorhizon]|nr:hypothetical protein Leryth_013107 [Lithospermum erythrorhizon]